jgi:hypothetical protein
VVPGREDPHEPEHEIRRVRPGPGRQQGHRADRRAPPDVGHRRPRPAPALEVLDRADQKGIEGWYGGFLGWLQTSELGKKESNTSNNHATWYDVDVATLALFTGKAATAKTVLQQVKARRIATQINPDGEQPAETSRVQSFHYSLFNLEAFFDLATLGQQAGVDLWHYQGEKGRSIRKALDFLVPYATGKKKWPHPKATDFRYEWMVALLRRAANAYGEPKYEQAISQVPGGAAGLEKPPSAPTDLIYPARRRPRTHLSWAEELVKGLRLESTSYRHKPTTVHWKGVDGAKIYESHTDCSGFLNELFKRAYGLTDEALAKWLLSKRPLARSYHDAITKQNQFQRVMLLKDAQPGDVIAVKYKPGDPDNTDNNTGHVLLIAKAPQPRQATEPLVRGTSQWEVTVIDQSRTGHGKTDTRHKPGGKFAPGLGQGVLRIYTHQSGTVAGYSWSTFSESAYHDQKDRHLVIGRPQLAPGPTAKPN